MQINTPSATSIIKSIKPKAPKKTKAAGKPPIAAEVDRILPIQTWPAWQPIKSEGNSK